MHPVTFHRRCFTAVYVRDTLSGKMASLIVHNEEIFSFCITKTGWLYLAKVGCTLCKINKTLVAGIEPVTCGLRNTRFRQLGLHHTLAYRGGSRG